MKQKTLFPQYIHHFKCIGSACQDSCCIGWRVDIDKDTYKKYRNTKHHELKELLAKRVTRNRSNPSSSNYAKIKMEKGACPFLTEEKLCHIQLELGEQYLSNTCTIYPRYTNSVNGVIERSATLSCPEVARLVILNPEVMEFDELLEDVSNRPVVKKSINTQAGVVANKPQKYFWELRIFTIGLLQNRSYQLWERLIILGLFYKKVDELIGQDNVHEIPPLIASYTNMINEGFFKEYLSEIPINSNIQMELLKELADERIFKGVNSARYFQCFKEFLVGVQYTKESSKEEITERYVEAYNSYYHPYMSQHEYMLESYLVNHAFKDLFPLGYKKQLFDSYVMLIIHYAMIKMHLIGMAGFHKDNFNSDHVLLLIQSFAKTVEHNNAYLNSVYHLLKTNGFTTMAYMAILIKNG